MDFEFDLDEVLENLFDNVKAPDDGTIQDIFDIVNFKDRVISLRAINYNETGSLIFNTIRTINLMDKDKPISEREPIKIFIDSDGGSLVDGFEVIDAIKTSQTPVYTYVSGMAYSCGLLIAISGHKRFGFPLSSFLLHEGSIGSGVQDAHKFKKYAEFYNKQLGIFKNIILSSTKITEEEYNSIYKDDNWYTAEEALEKGFIDEIVRTMV